MRVNKLRALCETISNAYPDFVNGICADAEKGGFTDQMIDFIEHNQNLRTGDVINHLDMLEGRPRPTLIIEDN